jgi:hypothetical protein
MKLRLACMLGSMIALAGHASADGLKPQVSGQPGPIAGAARPAMLALPALPQSAPVVSDLTGAGATVHIPDANGGSTLLAQLLGLYP